jgi:hypothetical protein
MPSPFPGMDPYLEGYLWSDFHHRFATQISDQLADFLKPRYVARLTTRMVKDHIDPAELGIFYPDVEVVKPQQPQPAIDWALRLGQAAVAVPPGLVLPAPIIIDVPIVSVEIQDARGGTLVTSIEILSPVNKREPGFTEYQLKRERVLGGGASLLELDFLRRGRRPVEAKLPNEPFFIFLTRAKQGRLEVGPVSLRQPLPIVPVPLRKPDPDIPLDLATAFAVIYDRAVYDLSIDYRDKSDVPLSPDDAAWADELLRKTGKR